MSMTLSKNTVDIIANDSAEPKKDPREQAELWASTHLPEEVEGEFYCYSTHRMPANREDYVKSKGCKWKDYFVSTRKELLEKLLALRGEANTDTFVALSTFAVGADGQLARKVPNARRRKVIANDFDVVTPNKPNEKDGKSASLKDAERQAQGVHADLGVNPTFVKSGRGLHTYIALDKAYSVEEVKPVAEKVKEFAKKAGYKIDESVTADMARVLRLPGMLHRKNQEPLDVELGNVGTEVSLAEVESFVRKALRGLGEGVASELVPVGGTVLTNGAVKGVDTLTNSLAGYDKPVDVSANREAIASAVDYLIGKGHQEEYHSWWGVIKDLAAGSRVSGTSDDDGTFLKAEAVRFSQASKTWDEEEFEQKWNDPSILHGGLKNLFSVAGGLGWKNPGTGGALFGGAGAASGEDDPNFAWVHEFNALYTPVLYGNKMAVAFEEYNDALKRKAWKFVNFCTFKEMHLSKKAVVGYNGKGAPTVGPKGEGWLKHPQCAERRKFVFDPAQPPRMERDGYLNLWSGLNVTGDPSKGDAMPMVEHIHKVIAGGDKGISEYIMKWVALLLQRPGERHEVALVMRGIEGAGKGTLGQLLVNLLGNHALHAIKRDQLTGKFNGHLRDCCFVFADEAYFAGDRSDEGTLKGLITEQVISIEAKGWDVIQAKNRLSVLMSTNENYAVPATADSRRFMVVDVSSDRVGDTEYWNHMHAWRNNPDNVAAFLAYMQSIDLTNYNPRKFIETRALQEQRAHSLAPWASWWQQILVDGRVRAFGEEWREYAKVSDLHRAFMDYCDEHRLDKYARLHREAFGRELQRHKLVSATATHRIRAAEELLGMATLSKDQKGGVVCCRRVGTLEEAREAFIKEFKVPADTFD